eukprot:3720640-Pleurochrysis_carterae.AAC.1
MRPTRKELRESDAVFRSSSDGMQAPMRASSSFVRSALARFLSRAFFCATLFSRALVFARSVFYAHS